MLPRTPLGLLNNIGLINYLDELTLDKIYIKGFHYWEPITLNKNKEMKSICVAHCFYEDSFAEEHNLHINDIKTLNYDYYILGHDHSPYEDVMVDKSKIFRIGSLSRGTANDKQLIRDKVFILEYDTELELFTKIPVPCSPAREVFNESIFLRKEEQQLDTRKILDNLIFTSNDSIYDVLDRSEQTEDIKKIVEEYLQAAGIFRIQK